MESQNRNFYADFLDGPIYTLVGGWSSGGWYAPAFNLYYICAPPPPSRLALVEEADAIRLHNPRLASINDWSTWLLALHDPRYGPRGRTDPRQSHLTRSAALVRYRLMSRLVSRAPSLSTIRAGGLFFVLGNFPLDAAPPSVLLR